MPNECWNRLVVEGPEAEVQRFVDRVVSKELDRRGKPYLLDFEAHVPVPPEVRENTRTGSDGPDIRRWAPCHWGCLQPMSVEITQRTPGRVVYLMTTPVGVPTPWLEATVAAEPSLAFEHEYLFEFDDAGCRVRYEGGKIVRVDEVEPTDFEWVQPEDRAP